MHTERLAVFEADRDKVTQEISQCQSRVIQTMVPTILALGLIAVADSNCVGILTLGCCFSILFCSSLYVACLSHKIFKNSRFLKVFCRPQARKGTVYWEHALDRYRSSTDRLPLSSETVTAGTIYAVLAMTFFFVFHESYPVASLVCALLLLAVAFAIFAVYVQRNRSVAAWKIVRSELLAEVKREEGDMDSSVSPEG